MMNCTPKVGQKTFGVQFRREFSARCAEVGESGFAPTVWYSMIYICNGMIIGRDTPHPYERSIQ